MTDKISAKRPGRPGPGPANIRHIVHRHLAEQLDKPYDPGSPELGVLLTDHFTHATLHQWRLVLDGDRLQVELHRRTPDSEVVAVLAHADLSDPDSLREHTITQLLDLALTLAARVTATGPRPR